MQPRMTDTRRAAHALVARRTDRFESRHACPEARRRLEERIATLGPLRRVAFTPAWLEGEGGCVLEATFAPARGAQRFLSVLSLVLFALLVATLYAWVLGDSPTWRYALLIGTVLATLGLPLVIVGLGSQREADEARILKAIRVALLDETPGYGPANSWDDEEEEK